MKTLQVVRLLHKQNGLGETSPEAYFHPRLAHALQSPNPSQIDKITSATLPYGFGEGSHPHERMQVPHPQTSCDRVKTNAESEWEAGYQLAMLITAVGLAFAAYASLLHEANRLCRVFALMALITLAIRMVQFLMMSAA